MSLCYEVQPSSTTEATTASPPTHHDVDISSVPARAKSKRVQAQNTDNTEEGRAYSHALVLAHSAARLPQGTDAVRLVEVDVGLVALREGDHPREVDHLSLHAVDSLNLK